MKQIKRFNEINGRVAEQTREMAIINEALRKETLARRRAEEAMCESERHLCDMFDHAPIGMTLTSPYGRWLKVNRAFCEMLGYSEQEFLGMTFQEVLHPDDLEANLEGFRQLLTGEMQLFSMEGRCFRKDGQIVWVGVSTTVLKSADGKSLYYISHLQNITDRKRSAEQIHFQASLLDQVRNGVIAIDLEQKIIVWNRDAETLFRWKSGEALGRNAVELLASGENRDAAEEALASLRKSGHLEGEFILQRKEGGAFPVYVSAAEIRGSDGVVAGFVAICADITERNGREAALRQAQERAESILEGMADNHIFFDRQWRYVYINEAAVRAMGRPREKILGRTLWELYPDIVGSELERQYRHAMDERIPVAFDFYYLTTDTWWDNRFYPAPHGLSVFATDITARKRAEEENLRLHREMEAQVEELHTLLEILPAGVWIGNQDCSEITGNPAAYQIVGFTPGINASLTSPTHETSEGLKIFVNGAEVPPESAPMQQVARTGKPWHNFEHDLLFPDGTRKTVYASIAPLFDQRGAVRKVIGAYVDITGRKRAEEVLADYAKRMQALSGRLLEVQETERRRIARELHDEIGQSLTAIKIQLYFAQRHSNGQSPRLKECLEIVGHALTQVRELSLDLHPPQLDELGLIATLRWHLDRQAKGANLIPRFSAGRLPARLHPDIEMACFRVGQEAITNVIRHAAASRVAVRLFQRDTALHLVIRDNGHGFNTEAAHRRAAQGISLGLVGMQERVQLAGGRMDLRSSLGEGTEVHAVFPLRRCSKNAI